MTLLTRYKQLTHAVVDLVNAPRGDSVAQYRSRYLLPQRDRQELLAAGRYATERDLAHATTGEISMRLRGTQFAITRHAADLAKLGESDMLIGTLAGDAPLANAAHHLAWHRALYHHTDVECVFVGQPLNTLALAISGQLPEACNADLARTIGGVVLVEASQLPQTLVDQVANTHAFVIPGLGCLVWGNSPRDTVARADALERAARLTVMITMLRPAHKSAGMPSTLPPPRQQM